MSNPICLLDDCLNPQKRLRICNAHYLRALRAGTLDDVLALLPSRSCAVCSRVLPIRARITKVYCSTRCRNVATWRACDKVERAAQNKEWRDATRDMRAAATVERFAHLTCEECDAALDAQRSTRRFCSRKCANRRADRENPHRRAEYRHRRRAAMRASAAPAGVVERDWRRLCARHDWCCAYCESAKPLTVDHVVPLIRGGTHSIGNVLPACFSCNASKKDRLLIAWRTRILPARLAT